jgi:hypothetical protein
VLLVDAGESRFGGIQEVHVDCIRAGQHQSNSGQTLVNASKTLPHLEVVLVNGHLKVQPGELTQVAVGVAVLSPAPIRDTKGRTDKLGTIVHQSYAV